MTDGTLTKTVSLNSKPTCLKILHYANPIIHSFTGTICNILSVFVRYLVFVANYCHVANVHNDGRNPTFWGPCRREQDCSVPLPCTENLPQTDSCETDWWSNFWRFVGFTVLDDVFLHFDISSGMQRTLVPFDGLSWNVFCAVQRTQWRLPSF